MLTFIFMKVMGLVFRMLGGSHASAHKRGFTQQQYQQKQPPPGSGNVHIDYVPRKDKKSADRFKGGEYVDYEEVE